jgi:hypothetical protein
MNPDDRLGDAIREIAAAMAYNTKDRVRMTVRIGNLDAVYEVRLISARTRPKPCRAQRSLNAHQRAWGSE